MPHIIQIEDYEKCCINCGGFHPLFRADGTPNYMGHCAWNCNKYKSVTDTCTKYKECNVGRHKATWKTDKVWERMRKEGAI